MLPEAEEEHQLTQIIQIILEMEVMVAVLLVEKGKEQAIEMIPELPERLEAPVEKDQEIGKIRCVLEGKELVSLPVYAGAAVEAVSWDKIFLLLLQNLGTF